MNLKQAQKAVGVKEDGRWGPVSANAIAAKMQRDGNYDFFDGLKLGRHFTLGEMIFSQTAARRRIKNLPNGAQILSLVRLVRNVLDPVRAHFKKPVRVSSGFRGPQLNRAIGGSPRSQHSHGEAADISVSGVSVRQVCAFIRDNLEYDQLIYEFGRWTHVSYRKGRLRKQDLSAVKRRKWGRMRTVYLSGIGLS